LFQRGTTNTLDVATAEHALQASVDAFAQLTRLTENSYRFANSMQTSHRKIPFPGAVNGVGTNYHWTQVLPLYQKELEDFRAKVADLKAGKTVTLFETNAPVRLNKNNPEIAEPQ
jgi:hypothetical protein